jgi:serine/threonine protein kinase
MSAELKRVTNTEGWKQWEGRVVNGVFRLRRFLGGSNHSAVFLTEHKAKKLSDVAIKFVPADTLQAEVQLAQWRTAATLSHPHLVRLFDVGRCQLGKREFLFVVMEYAEQTLAQVLGKRALVGDEVQELLLPTLDTLAFLHRNHLMHGQLRPSNFLAIDDRLKLASDTVRPIGNSASGIVRTSLYDPPELKGGEISAAGDIWGLGITLAEALTQHAPLWSDERCETASLPANFPAPFADTVRRCLSLAPAHRPTVMELEALYKPAPQSQPISEPKPLAREAPRKATAPRSFPRRHPWLVTIAAALLLGLVVWAALNSSDASQAPVQPPAIPVPAPVAPAAVAPAAVAKSYSGLSTPISHPQGPPSLPPAATSPSVLLEVSPDVPQTVLDKIQGQVSVTVRVLVGPSGDVAGALLDSPGASRYFARLASEAAQEWKFVPDDNPDTRVWLLRFAFNRDGVTTQAAALQ